MVLKSQVQGSREAGLHVYSKYINGCIKRQADPPSPSDRLRAMAEQVGKVVVLSIHLVCEHLPEVCAAP